MVLFSAVVIYFRKEWEEPLLHYSAPLPPAHELLETSPNTSPGACWDLCFFAYNWRLSVPRLLIGARNLEFYVKSSILKVGSKFLLKAHTMLSQTKILGWTYEVATLWGHMLAVCHLQSKLINWSGRRRARFKNWAITLSTEIKCPT